MNRILFPIALALTIPVSTRDVLADRDPPANRPHIVFLLADDLGWSDVGFHGSEIETRHVDRLAESGARLDAFYVQPVCSPTRAALMTGRYPMRMGLQVGVIRPFADYGLPLDERMLPAALQEAGYETAISGKWHLGLHAPEFLPTRRGFDHQYGHYVGALDYFTHRRDGGFDWHRDDQVCRDEGYTTTLIGDEAVRLIDAHDTSKPLFLYVPFNAPHSPLQAPDEYLSLYEHIKNKKRRAYAAMVHCLDDQVGRIVRAIEERGLTSETLFVFCSDNGGPKRLGATNGPLRAGKGSLYEGGVRVAACAAWPGHIEPGTIVEEPLHMIDWYPTLLNLAGASLEQHHPIDGKDILDVLSAGGSSPHDEILLNTTPTGGALRSGDWKIVLRGDRSAVDVKQNAGDSEEKVELFHLAEDLSEQSNLADQFPDKLQELRTRLNEYARSAVPPRNKPKAADFRTPEIWGE